MGKMDVIMLREMCAVRGIELESDRSQKQTCITALMEWKAGSESAETQTQTEAPAKKKAKNDRWQPTQGNGPDGWPSPHDQVQSYCGNAGPHFALRKKTFVDERRHEASSC